jgi:hypothetical protein
LTSRSTRSAPTREDRTGHDAVVYKTRLGYDDSLNGIHGVGGILDILVTGCSPLCEAKGWLPENPPPVRLPGVTILATTVGLWRRCGRRQNSSAESRLSQDEARIYAKDLSVEAQGPCAIKEA